MPKQFAYDFIQNHSDVCVTVDMLVDNYYNHQATEAEKQGARDGFNYLIRNKDLVQDENGCLSIP